MVEKDRFSYIEDNEWYLQGTDYRMMFGFHCWIAFLKENGAHSAIGCCLKNHQKAFFSKNFYQKALKPVISRQLKDKKTVDQFYQKWKLKLNKLKKILKKLEKIDFEKSDYQMIKKLMIRLNEQNIALWSKSWLIEMTDSEGWGLLKSIIKKQGFNISENILKELSHPEKKLYLQEMELKLLRIAQEVKKNIKVKKDILKILKPITKSYFFIKTGWGHAYTLNQENFYQELLKLQKKDNQIIAKQIKELENYSQKVKKQKKKLIKKYKFNQASNNLFYFFTQLAYWRDQRKKYAQIINNYSYYFAQRNAKEWGLPLELALDLYINEIKKLPQRLSKSRLRKLKQKLEKRRKFNVIHGIGKNGIKIITGAKARQLAKRIENRFTKQHKEIKGNIGNCGCCRARVKIIKGDKEFFKFRAGNIIVAPMTRPEYILLMKKAAGIITDEGGVACHAAIVSRELNIPCIIGTQVATQFLKDNDLVELNADKGIVKIIKR